MDYDELIRRLFQGDMEGTIMEGTAFSFPVAGRIGQTRCDKFFLYTINRKSGKHSEPFARFALDAEKGHLLVFQEKGETGAKEETTVPELTAEEYRKVFDSFKKDYMMIRKIAYRRDCNDEERHALQRLLEEYRYLAGDKPPYLEMAPEFFEWAERQLGK